MTASTLPPAPRPPSRSARLHRAVALAACATALLVAACAQAPRTDAYAAEQPVLDLRTYFNGPLKAHGVFRDRSGRVVRRFVVELTGTWQGPPGQETGVLDERFTYLDAERRGQTERRVWRLRHLGTDGGVARYEGQADDVVGVARGQTQGNAFHWSYTLQLPVDGRLIDVQLDDWMHLVDGQVLLNHAVMSKWGMHLGDLQIAFTKQP